MTPASPLAILEGANQPRERIAMTTQAMYEEAIGHFTDNLNRIKPPESDPLLWNLSSGLRLLAQAIRQDMQELRKRTSDIDSNVRG